MRWAGFLFVRMTECAVQFFNLMCAKKKKKFAEEVRSVEGPSTQDFEFLNIIVSKRRRVS